jgi:hypothetical protein|tara:strand:+ start:579 stop:1343 length:765 start_codon:yes stop_codon:yes gene_type:complete
MFGNHYYNQSFRKLTVAFGQIFNNILVQTKNKTGGVTGRMRVPLAYAPKEKFIQRLDQQSDLNNREFAVVLPRMGFEITGLAYDGSRKLTRVQKRVKVKNDETMNFNYQPVPYDISFNLYTFTATAENGLQIIEQILPYFQPDYTVTINAVPEMDIKTDVPIILNGVQYEDTYDGSFTNRRAVIYTLGFTAKTYLYGPMNNSKIIRKVTADASADLPNALTQEKIVIQPNPTSADADDDFGFTTTITFYENGEQ